MIDLKIRADYLVFLARFACTSKEGRQKYRLKGIHFNKDLSIVATDGHRLGLLKNAFRLLGSEQISDDGFSIDFGADGLKLLKQQKEKDVRIEVEGLQAKIITETVSFFAEVVNALYPDFQKVIPMNENGNGVKSISFNPSFLADFGGYKKGDRLKIEFASDDARSPFIVKNSELADFIGVLMPVFCDF